MAFYSGYNTEKTSSRCSNPPGGRCSNIFGYDEPPKANNQAENLHAQEVETAKHEKEEQQHQQQLKKNLQQQQQHAIVAEQYQHNRDNRDKRSGYNPITGIAYGNGNGTTEAPKSQQTAAAPSSATSASVIDGGGKTLPGIHTSSRVLQPPGGKSTSLW